MKISRRGASRFRTRTTVRFVPSCPWGAESEASPASVASLLAVSHSPTLQVENAFGSGNGAVGHKDVFAGRHSIVDNHIQAARCGWGDTVEFS